MVLSFGEHISRAAWGFPSPAEPGWTDIELEFLFSQRKRRLPPVSS